MDITKRLISSRVGQRAKRPVREVLSRLGYELSPTTRPENLYLRGLLERQGVRTVIDVGANQGQFALGMRRLGWQGPIISIEPMLEAVKLLDRASLTDPYWSAVHTAVGAKTGEAILHRSKNSVSSSLLDVAEAHVLAEPTSAVIEEMAVPVQPLDDIVVTQAMATGPYLLKIDTQGYESEVLKGSLRTLAHTTVLQLELSLRELYLGAPSWLTLLRELEAEGFTAVWIRPAFLDPRTGDSLQVDVTLARLGYESDGPI